MPAFAYAARRGGRETITGVIESGDRTDQIFTATAPAITNFFTALGTLVGETIASAVTPLPDDPDPVPVQ